MPSSKLRRLLAEQWTSPQTFLASPEACQRRLRCRPSSGLMTQSESFTPLCGHAMIAINRAVSEPTDKRPIFEPGQLVRHRRYGYRGVVVDRDDSCQADATWYQKNQTQPDRDQPWYHVLVDGSATCTYAAAENLAADPTGLPVTHPLVPFFFSGMKGDAYQRNDEPWLGE
jgi:heat shock protein HspQ